MNIQALLNPLIVSLAVGLVLGAGLLFLLVKYAIAWLIDSRQTAPAQSQAVATHRRTLTGLSWIIATTHRSASQLIGLVMSFATLIAIVLSIICAVAGITIISYQQYGNIGLTAISALATFILALIIESISLNALKNIRLSNEEIAQAEQEHYQQIVSQMEEQFEEDAQVFAQVNHQTLSKEEVESMKRATHLKQQARKQFEKKRRELMRQQTRTARHTRNMSIPFAVTGILFSATAGGLFWHTALASLDAWLNITIGTMFALAVSVAFIQSELLKRIRDEAIKEALQSGEMQSTMLRQQSEEMVLEMVVDSMAVTKEDPNTLQEMGETIKGELKTAIRTLTAQTTSRLVEKTDGHPEYSVSEVVESVPQIEEKAVSKRQRKEPEWWSHPALSMLEKMHPNMHLKLASWKSTSRISVSMDVAINTLIEITGQSRRTIQNRIKDGTLKATPHNSKLILISCILEWLQTADLPTVAKNEPHSETEEVPTTMKNGETPNELPTANSQSTTPLAKNDKLSIAFSMVRQFPDITDEELAAALGFSRPASARFWKVKAREMIQAAEKERSNGMSGNDAAAPQVASTIDQAATKQNGHTQNKSVSLDEFPSLLL